MNRTDCPSHETLSAFALGDLPEPKLGAVCASSRGLHRVEEQASRLDGIADAVVADLRRLPSTFLDTDKADTTQAGSGAGPSLPETGEPWGEFRIIREIGRGGMAVVFEAFEGTLNRHVALKFLPEPATSPGSVARPAPPGGCAIPTSSPSSACASTSGGTST